MSQKTRFFIFGGLVVFAVLGVGYYKMRANMPSVATDNNEVIVPGEPLPNDANEEEGKITDKAIGSPPSVGGQSGVAIKISDNQETNEAAPWDAQAPVVSMPVPNLDRPLIFPGGYPVERAEKIKEQIAALTATLKESNNRFQEWMDLALLRKSIEDHEGARDIWEYAGAIRPGNSLSFANLGTLYGYYLNNPLKAEENLLHAIENEPLFLDFYARMTDFYVEVMKDKGKAADFLDRAIEKYPDWTEIKDLQKHLTESR